MMLLFLLVNPILKFRLELKFGIASLVLLLAGLVFNSQATAQKKSFANYLDSDIAAMVVVSNPAQIVREAGELGIFEHEHFNNALELASHEDYGFVSKEVLDDIRLLFSQLPELLSRIDEFAVVIHDMDNIDISFLMKTDSQTQEDLSKWSKRFTDHINTLPFPLNGLAQNRRSISRFFDVTDEWAVISTSSEIGADIVQRMRQPAKFRTLRQSRRYLTVEKFFEKKLDNECYVIVYGQPKALSSLYFPGLSEKEVAAHKFEELSSIGVLLTVNGQRNPDSEHLVPKFTVDLIIPTTYPRSGIAKTLDSVQSLGELPPIPFSITDLVAKANDPKSMHEAKREIMDAANGSGSYEKQLQDAADRLGISDFKRTLAKSHLGMGMRHFRDNGIRLYAMQILKVENYEAMKEYRDGLLSRSKRSRGRQNYRKVDSDYGELYTSYRESKGNGSENQAPNAPESRAYYLDQNWFILGGHFAVVDQVKAIYEGAQSCVAMKAIDTVLQRFGSRDDVYEVRFHRFWKSDPWKPESERIRAKHPKRAEFRDVIMKKPNELGYRLTIDDRDDCIAVVTSLIQNAIDKSLGSYVLAFSNAENRLIVRGALFTDLNRDQLRYKKQNEKQE